MSALPDPDALDAIAGRIAAHAQAARNRAAVLNAAIVALTWRGAAAGVFDDRAAGVLTGLRLAADRLDDAADALHRHAAAVRNALDVLIRLERSLQDDVVDAGLAALRLAPTVLPIVGGISEIATGPVGGLADLLGIY